LIRTKEKVSNCKTFTIRLFPTEEQEHLLWQAVNARRNAYNFGLAVQMERFKNKEKLLSAIELRDLYKQEKPKWVSDDVAVNNHYQAFIDLSEAYARYFKHQKNKHGMERYSKKKIAKFKRLGKTLTVYDQECHPKFKIRFKCSDSFSPQCDSVHIRHKKNFGYYVSVARVGKVKCDFSHMADTLINPTIKHENDKWLLVFGLPVSEMNKTLDGFVGIDLGVKDIATIAYDDRVERIKNINKTSKMRKLEKRRKRAQRKMSRRFKENQKQSANYQKSLKSYRNLSRKLRNVRRDYTHKSTRKIIDTLPLRIGLEDLCVQGMLKNKHLSKAVQDCNLSEFVRQLKYKAAFQGTEIVQVSRWFPSTQTCSGCGNVKTGKDKLKLSDRIYKCDVCGLEVDRDDNASLNLRQEAKFVA
jgi:putative transposase